MVIIEMQVNNFGLNDKQEYDFLAKGMEMKYTITLRKEVEKGFIETNCREGLCSELCCMSELFDL